MNSEQIQVSGLDGESKLLDRARLDGLGERLEGRILLPRDPEWSEAAGIWNGMVAKVPAVVIRPSSAADVLAVVDFVREENS